MSGSEPEMMGVILAAGKGTRIYPFSKTLPKPILPVGNRPLLEVQLEMLKAQGIRRVIIVIGHLGHAIVNALGDGTRLGLEIQYVEQPDTLGLAHAVGKLEPYIDSPFLLLLGDIYLVADDLLPAMAEVTSGRASALLASKIETDPAMIQRNFAILSDEDGRVRRVIEKPRHPLSQVKGCGLYVFDLPVFDAIRRTPRTAMRDEYEITDTIQIMIDDGLTVRHAPIVTEDINLTVPADLLEINLLDLHRRNLDKLVGEGSSFPEGTVIEGSVVGKNVVVTHPIRITRSLLLEGTQIDQQTNLDGVIAHELSTIQC